MMPFGRFETFSVELETADGDKAYWNWSSSDLESVLEFARNDYIFAKLNLKPLKKLEIHRKLYIKNEENECPITRMPETKEVRNILPEFDQDEELNIKCLPTIGMGATEMMYSDRRPFTVIGMTEKTVTVQADKATRIDKNGMSECQEYEYSPDPTGEIVVLHATKKRGWCNKNRRFTLGFRRKYFDYSF